jgi:hypothetical protein
MDYNDHERIRERNYRSDRDDRGHRSEKSHQKDSKSYKYDDQYYYEKGYLPKKNKKEDKKGKKTKKDKKISTKLIQSTDHLTLLSEKEIEKKMDHMDINRIEHASFIVKYNKLFNQAVKLAETNFFVPPPDPTNTNNTTNRPQTHNLTYNQSITSDGNQPSHNNNPTSLPPKKPKKLPNYFTTQLLIPHTTIPTDYTKLDQPLTLSMNNMDDAYGDPRQRLNKNAQSSNPQNDPNDPNDPNNEKISKMNLEIAQARITTQQTNLILSRYVEPDDAVNPSKYVYPNNVPNIPQWRIYIHDNSVKVVNSIQTSAKMKNIQDKIQQIQDPQKSDKIKSETGETLPSIKINTPLSSSSSLHSPITIDLTHRSVYKLGSDELLTDITLTSIPSYPKPVLSLIDSDPILNTHLGLQNEINTYIDETWEHIIQTNEQNINKIHSFIQFRLKPTQITLPISQTSSKSDNFTTISVMIPTPYLFTPPSIKTQNNTQNNNNSQCFFREPSSNSPTGFVKTPIPGSRFVEIQSGDVIIFGEGSFYEIVFLKAEKPNPNFGKKSEDHFGR